MAGVKRTIFSSEEAKRLLLLAFPVFTAQITQIAMSFVDTVVAGRYGAADMAAVSVASSFWVPGIMFGHGLLMAITPLVAQAMGSSDRARASEWFRQGVWGAALVTVLLVAGFCFAAQAVASWESMDHVLAAKTASYLRAVVWGVPALMAFGVQKAYLEGLGQTRPAMVAGIIGLILNIPLNILFVFGWCGFPEMGAAGCGVATAILLWAMAASMLFFVHRADAAAWAMKSPDYRLLKRLVAIGLPSALALLNETSAFAIIAVAVAPLGVAQVAGHQIAGNVSALVWMIPYSIGTAACIRMGTALGAGDLEAAQKSRLTSLILSLGAALLLSFGVFAFRQEIAAIYSSEVPVLEVASALLVCEALYEFPDAVQTNTLFALRAWNDTRSVFMGSFIAYWVVSLPLGTALCFGLVPGIGSLGALGFWLALIGGLSVAGVFYLLRFRRLGRLSREEAGRWLAQSH